MIDKSQIDNVQPEPQPHSDMKLIVPRSSPAIGNTNVSSSAGEYILCAAVHYDDKEYHEHTPHGINTGYVICGWRHHNCITLHFDITNKPTRESNSRQGFLTNKNRFVGRSEAAEIAFKSGQIETEIKTLFSEDVW